VTHTTLASWALVIWRSLESYHLDPRPAFNAAGIDVSGLQTPGQRVPYAAMQALWREAVARTKDPCFGLQTVDFIHSTTFHALGYAAMASNTLEDALCRVIRYGRLVATVFGAELRDEGQTLRLTEAAALPGDCPEAQDASVDAAIAAIVRRSLLWILSGASQIRNREALSGSRQSGGPSAIAHGQRRARAGQRAGDPGSSCAFRQGQHGHAGKGQDR
jgi:hypothetical protein